MPGTTTATITGTSGSIVVTTPLTVIVRAVSTATTALAVTASSAPVTSVVAGSVVSLTATVTAGSNPLTSGRVNFCDASATYCEDIHLLGSAQLTSAGTATLKFIPGIGSHSYKAVFAGTNGSAASVSGVSVLTVTGVVATTTAIAQSGVTGNYSLTATVTAAGPIAPTGGVSFLDTSNANAILGSATMGNANVSMSWLSQPSPATGSAPDSIAVGDFNGDGIPDLAVANYGSNTVTILLGNGDGSFTSSTNTVANPGSIIVADYNGDGIPDLAVTSGSNTVTIQTGQRTQTATATANGIAPVGQGVHLVDAKYLGDSFYKSSISGTTNLTGLLLPAITWSTPASIVYGTALSTTQLNASSPVAGSFTYSPAVGTVLGVGPQTLKATFTPTDTADYTTATSSVTLNVTQATPAVALHSSASNSILSSTVTFTANVTYSVGAPSGTVSFYDGATLLGSSALSSGAATYTTSTLGASVHSISAIYSGDTLFTTISSGLLTETVEDFTFVPASGSSSATASAGAKATYVLNFTPTVGTTFVGAISFAVSGLPSGATAVFSPATLQANSAASNITLTITTSSQTAALPASNPLRNRSLPVALGIFLLPFAVRREGVRRNALRKNGSLPGVKRIGGWAILLISIVWIAALSGCGGQSPELPAKTYPLTISASSGNLSQTTTVNLIVQ